MYLTREESQGSWNTDEKFSVTLPFGAAWGVIYWDTVYWDTVSYCLSSWVGK